MIVGIYLNNANYQNIDFSKPEDGNPGMRGTQYMIWQLACRLSSSSNGIDLVLFANYIDSMPDYVNCLRCDSEIEAAHISANLGVDIFILKATLSTKAEVFQVFDDYGIRCITWTHNFENCSLADLLSVSDCVKRNVCVGRQQFERLRDHELFNKSTYIYNGLDFSSYNEYKIPLDKKENIVTYVGALDKAKGFHKIAYNWKKITKKIPSAKLYVLGSGSLGKETNLGSLGIADEKYEKLLKRYICDRHGYILDSIKFFGNVGGSVQREIMSLSKVGVANPTGVGETFCIVAIEFQALGVPVVSAAKGGLLDTVRNKKDGILCRTNFGLRKAIVELLNNEKLNYKLGISGYDHVRQEFDISKITRQWEKLIYDVYDDVTVAPSKEYNYPLNQFKWLRELIRKIRTIHGLNCFPSLLKIEMVVRSLFRRIMR